MEPDHIRASDADRDRVADRLREALAEGRLTPEEHSERIDALYRSKTLGDLVPITADLPAAGVPSTDEPTGLSVSSEEAHRIAAGGQGRENIIAVFGGADRKGRWLVEPHTNASVLFGGIDLDLREAVLSRREVVIQCAVIFGGLDIIVPPGVRVINSTTAIFGGTSMNGVDTMTDPNSPTIRLTGTCLFGGIDVRVKKPKKKKAR
ncbi:DUF1707 SHOCT-like domain-containing protein [Marinactinospora thermotolerans]|uniref:Cell wall-active antibiotics response 4TMS YvqF n=1 Tax=Marinactinospora thermotolerans DSM 45154 TaxID=1122192 RepID=A0A1T4T2M9_9ACTN|nr:DUF1707 domain-containing protein [Marinactinospora thermotolerans]SKA34501.1 Cell wall-active antibiotics response 4TMS YvqF [Marinactinospora thermotolerans DSM 45154]